MFINILTLNTINWLGVRPSFLAQNAIKDLLDNEFAESNINKDNTDEFDNLRINELFDLFFTNAKVNSQTQKSKKQISKIDT